MVISLANFQIYIYQHIRSNIYFDADEAVDITTQYKRVYLPLTPSEELSSSGSLKEVFLLPARLLGEEPGVKPWRTSPAFLKTASRAARNPLAVIKIKCQLVLKMVNCIMCWNYQEVHLQKECNLVYILQSWLHRVGHYRELLSDKELFAVYQEHILKPHWKMSL